MDPTKNNKIPPELMATIGATISNKSEGYKGEMSPMEQIVTEYFADQKRTKDEAKQAMEAHKKALVAEITKARRDQQANQAGCQHLKENGRANLNGQRTHTGTLILVCSGCQKEFNDETLPPYLSQRLESSAIGGPHQVRAIA